ncbi:lipid A export permease/ATP-binding protein MsbA [Kangiella sp. HZ709]|uniref:lipid A export permease/ATP-binding protein MsbA n=1 Tax=Kangiella sp. HZ709 TaxID=2666328 RepID=UPI0012B1446A|nr:lipid A export permease/ATP-binding protein MsbA [Kangiella sp. HZ709]MRX26814.1 lipid A export permease/ATP-binding protein MsbA [Kangiella sp. HZ709]
MTESSATEQNSKQVYGRILGYTKRYKWAVFVGILANILYALVEASFVNAIQYLDVAIENKDRYVLLVKTPLVIIGAIFLRGILNFIATYCIGWTGRKVVQSLRQELFEHYLYQPNSFFKNRSAGELIAKITFNIEQVAQASSQAITIALRSGGMVIFSLIYMLIISWRLTLFVLIIAPAVGLIVNVSAKRFKKVSKGIQNTVGDVTHKTEESVRAQEVIKMFGGHSKQVSDFNQAANKNRLQDMKLIIAQGLASPMIQFIAGIGFAAVVYFGSLQILDGRMAGGQFITFIGFMMLILKPLKELSNVNSILQKGIAGAQSVFEILDRPSENDKGSLELHSVEQGIEYSNVSFSYKKSDELVLNQISFEVNKGKTIALVGRSGSGKSTITHLLPRLYDLSQGAIKIDGTEIQNFQLKSLRKQIAIVSQNVILFNDSVRNNIAYGFAEDATDEDIINAAKNANAWEFIQELPEGLDTNIGDNGSLLSGGQRQRIAIARAILKDAPILILDEATSALDTESERHIQNALENLMQNRTTIVVAHRLSTIESADEILVIHNGAIKEQGSHLELIAAKGEYYRLHQMQFSE